MCSHVDSQTLDYLLVILTKIINFYKFYKTENKNTIINSKKI